LPVIEMLPSAMIVIETGLARLPGLPLTLADP
jgi:hypothetical protein